MKFNGLVKKLPTVLIVSNTACWQNIPLALSISIWNKFYSFIH